MIRSASMERRGRRRKDCCVMWATPCSFHGAQRPPQHRRSRGSGCSASSAGSSVASGVSLDLANLLTMFQDFTFEVLKISTESYFPKPVNVGEFSA